MKKAATGSVELRKSKCVPCESGGKPLDEKRVRALHAQLDGWELASGEIGKSFGFGNYYETVSFINAVAWIAHTENHHPEIDFGYKKCRIRYSTHAVGGLSENDFICAAKVDALLAREGKD